MSTHGSIKLLKLHKKRLDVINSQLAMMGQFDNRATTHLLEKENIEEQIAAIENTLGRILMHRKEQQAISGINTDPEVLIDIEDIENVL